MGQAHGGRHRAISRIDNFDPVVHPTFFHLNHPIRFVRLVGTVVAVEDLGPRFVLLTLDDGSGATLELKVTRLSPAESAALHAAAASTTTTTIPTATTSSSSSSSSSIFHTSVDNLVVRSAIGVFEVLVGGVPIDIGTTIKAKATLGTFRGAMQGVLQRCWVLRGHGGAGNGGSSSTRDEAAEWLGTATFMLSVLAKPWVLSADDIRRLERRLAREEKQRRDEERRAERKRAERARRKEEVYRERREKVRVYEEKVERRRRQEEVLMNKGALV
ncbi:Ob-fold nucleic acid binding domain [Lasiodiplodia theobromae]|uniref:Ob-fold nucleic acid binding domain n=1 Tax=Lasiodiplodia theobromae TaxID=45133 RepID=UPI0015C32E27|nr:Ob-fold nucleic acid binding domain [Lasiodiplodia theobromae]KAF4542509.1 Ob-fold nucleic acid binding domain [Lasiodiplodia theobromae]